MVGQYEEQERDRQEQCRRIKMDAAEGAVLKNISLIEHGTLFVFPNKRIVPF
jgi:hypothetical protein